MNEWDEQDRGPAVAPRREATDPQYMTRRMRDEIPPHASGERPELGVRREAGSMDATRASGTRDIIGGLCLIGIGFLWGSSVYLGNPTALDWLFDGLGTFWVLKGLVRTFGS